MQLLTRLDIVSLSALVVLALIWPWTSVYAEEKKTSQDETNLETNVIPRGPDDISTRIKRDTKPKEVTFDFPGIDAFLKPWTDWKARIAKEHGFRLGFDYQPVVQWSDNTVGEDSAAGGIFRAFSSWDMWSRGNPTRTGTLDVRVEHRHKLGTDLAPEDLAFNFGWVGTTAPDWTNQKLGLPVFMLRQRLDVGDAPIELRIGRMSAFAQFDITPYSDNLTTFMNNSIILNPTIGYPSAGSFGVAGYVGIPNSKFYVLGMVMDANGEFDGSGDIGKGEWFTGIEFGWSDQDLSTFGYLFNNVHATFWHNDRNGQGFTLTGSYTFAKQRWGVFARLGQTSEKSTTLYHKYVAAGVTKSVYRDSMFGFGASWGEPPNSNTSQVATELFYRWQMAQNLALTPNIQVLFDPALNPIDDVVTVLGLRARITF